ncbi:MAG: hypothetical protein WCV67_05940 [Victivallaceae bacterium]|jgi:hypothetical protein
MPFILLAIVAIAAILVAGISAVHGPTILTTGTATITPVNSGDGLSLLLWFLVIAVIGLFGWWLVRRRKS